MTDDDKPRLEIDWVKTFAGALAAVSTAVLLSTLGAAGTLIGAALGSIVVTISSAFYSQGLARSKHRLAAAQALAAQKVSKAQSEVRRANRASDEAVAVEHLDQAEEELAEASAELDDSTDDKGPVTWRERLVLLPWKKIAIGAAGLFLVAMLVITGFELLSGRTVASYTGGSDSKGGTSLTRVGGDSSKGSDKKNNKDDKKAPSDNSTSNEDPTDEPTTSESADPSETPSEDASETPTSDPSETPSETPSATPTEQIAPNATPTG